MSGKNIPDDPAELRRDIEATRRELGDTVEALAHKVDVPGRVKESVHDGVDKAKVKAGEAATRVDQAVSRAAVETQAAADSVVHKASEVASHAVDALPAPVRDQVRRRPLTVPVVLVTAALVVTWLVRRSR